MLVNNILDQLGTAAKGRTDVEFLSYSRDFEKIWSSTLSPPKWTPEGDIFMIWDGVPRQAAEPEVGVRDFLTVYDWAAVMALRAQSDPASQSFGFRLYILQVESADRWRKSFSVRAAPLLASAMPWMESSSMAQARRFFDAAKPTSTTPLDPAPTLAAFSTAKDESGERAADLIRDLWKSALIKPGVSHSVSNAIGPAALAQYLKTDNFPAADFVLSKWFKEDGNLRPKFWRLLEIVGLLRPLQRRDRPTTPQPVLGGLADRPFVKENLFGQFSDIRFALVDDQAGAGFHDVLGAFLLGHDLEREPPQRGPAPWAPAAASRSKGGRLTLTSFARPKILLEWLVKVAEPRPDGPHHRPPFGRSSLYSSSRAPAAALSEFDILFLDLRLHGISGAPVERDNESKWTTKLLAFVQGGLEAVISKHRLTDAQQHALGVATRAATQRLAGTGDAETIVAQLALLPIAISICDPTVPIILFSSTRQRVVLELLQPFPNIITSFAKPALTGYGEEDQLTLDSVVPSLTRALYEALVLHEKRCLWDLIGGFELKQAVPPPCVLAAPEAPNMFVAEMNVQVNGRYRQIKQYLANTSGRRDLPFLINDWYDTRLRTLILDFIVGSPDIDHIYKPYEFLESCMNAARQLDVEAPLDMKFQPPKFKPFIHAKIIPKPPDRSLAVEDIKKARHKVVHGLMASKAIDPEIIRYVGLMVLLKFLFGIHPPLLKPRLEALHAASNPLIRVVTTGRFLKTDRTVYRADARGPLVRSVVAYANELWPWAENLAAVAFMDELAKSP